MTNKEIAKGIANLIERKNGTPDCDEFTLQLFLETLNDPTKYSDGVGYYRENIELAVMDLLKEKRLNGVHFMDLSEPMENK